MRSITYTLHINAVKLAGCILHIVRGSIFSPGHAQQPTGFGLFVLFDISKLCFSATFNLLQICIKN